MSRPTDHKLRKNQPGLSDKARITVLKVANTATKTALEELKNESIDTMRELHAAKMHIEAMAKRIAKLEHEKHCRCNGDGA